MLFLFVICFFVEPSQSIGDEKRFTALKFGNTLNDYVQFSNYDMSPFRNALTMCSWMRRVYTGSDLSAVVLHFYTSSENYEILISPTGSYNRVAGSYPVDYLSSKFTTPVGTWLHYCVSWATSTHTIQVYLNGAQVASGQVSSSYQRQLHTPGTLTFGRAFPDTSTSYIFRGEVFDLNMYTKVLNPEVISRMAARTVCGGAGEYEEDRYRVFRWEQLLEQSRSGAVTEVNVLENHWKTCAMVPREFLARKIRITIETQTDLNQTREDLATVKAQLNKVMAELNITQQALEEVKGSLNRTEEELLETRDSLRDESVRCNRTEKMLTERVSELNMTKGELNQTEEQLGTCSRSLKETSNELNRTTEHLGACSTALTKTKTVLNQTSEELATSSAALLETNGELNQTKEQLGTCSRSLAETNNELNRTTEQLETLSLQQEETEENLKKKEEEQEICTSKLEEARKFENISRFDVLFTSPYYNKIFTEELLHRLKSSWNILSEFA